MPKKENEKMFEIFRIGAGLLGLVAILIFIACIIKYFVFKAEVLWGRSLITLIIGIGLFAWASKSK